MWAPQTDPGTSASYQPAPNGTNYISSVGQGYCNSTSANNGAPGYGTPSNEPYCNVPVGNATLAQPTWSAYRCTHVFLAQNDCLV